jgi:hypothetical protein
MSNKGLDIGTNMLVAASLDDNNKPMFKMERDAYYKIVPKSEVNKNSIRMSLEKRGSNFIIDGNDFIVVGNDALEIAIERNDIAMRPMQKGIISPKEKDAMPMLKLMLDTLLGKGNNGDKVIYSVPAKPIDGVFDIVYHTEIMGMFLSELGYQSFPINESFAIALSELLDDGLTGICLSWGAGLVNVCVLHQGDPLVEFSITRSGDYIDYSVGNALDISPSLVQLEKESGVDLFSSTNNEIIEAVRVYYLSVIKYVLENISYELLHRKKSLPIFRESVPIIVSGGLTLAKGFTAQIKQVLSDVELPMKISDVIRAEDPMRCVANGALLAAQI